ncbi:MAG: hypothetical protein GY723_12950, partial [bacterium]|nr:hypothetical protein [bacterium]
MHDTTKLTELIKAVSIHEDERNPAKLTEFAKTFLTEIGACEVGVCTTETLAGGPPSTDLEYVLPGAKSAVSFAVQMDQEKIERYLA